MRCVPWSPPPPLTYSTDSNDEYISQLTKARENERAIAIANGILAHPDKRRTLAEAVTPVGTCMDMCPEYERAERVVQRDVWTEERVGTWSLHLGRSAVA